MFIKISQWIGILCIPIFFPIAYYILHQIFYAQKKNHIIIQFRSKNKKSKKKLSFASHVRDVKQIVRLAQVLAQRSRKYCLETSQIQSVRLDRALPAVQSSSFSGKSSLSLSIRHFDVSSHPLAPAYHTFSSLYVPRYFLLF